MDFVSNLLTAWDNWLTLTYFDAIDLIKSSETNLDAIKSGEMLLSPFTSIDQYDRMGRMPLHYAIQSGSQLACEWILSEAGVNVNAPTEFEYWNSAHCAVQAENSDLLTKLIELGVDLNALDSFALTPLAYSKSDMEAQRWIHNLELTPLNFKLALGAFERNYFHYLARDSSSILLDYVLAHAPSSLIDKPDNTGTTALMLAAENGHIESLEKLLKAGGAHFDQINWEGRTALHLAASAGQTAACRILLFKNGDKDKEEEKEEEEEFVVDVIEGEDFDFKMKQLKSEAVLLVADKNGMTPLMLAVLQGHIESVKELVKLSKHHLDLQNELTGDSAMHYAAQSNFSEIASILLVAGAFADPLNKKGLKPLDLVPEDSLNDFLDLSIVMC